MINETLVGLVLVVMVMVDGKGDGNGELFVAAGKIGASFLPSSIQLRCFKVVRASLRGTDNCTINISHTRWFLQNIAQCALMIGKGSERCCTYWGLGSHGGF